MLKLITLIGLILLETVTTVMSGCSQENTMKLKVAICRLAADLGDAREQFKLGRAYYNGEYVAQDKVEAVRWFRKAAEQGEVKAQHNLGVSYCSGEGVGQDYKEALRILEEN